MSTLTVLRKFRVTLNGATHRASEIRLTQDALTEVINVLSENELWESRIFLRSADGPVYAQVVRGEGEVVRESYSECPLPLRFRPSEDTFVVVKVRPRPSQAAPVSAAITINVRDDDRVKAAFATMTAYRGEETAREQVLQRALVNDGLADEVLSLFDAVTAMKSPVPLKLTVSGTLMNMLRRGTSRKYAKQFETIVPFLRDCGVL